MAQTLRGRSGWPDEQGRWKIRRMTDPLLLQLIADLSTRVAALEAREARPAVQAAAPAPRPPAPTKAPAAKKAKPAPAPAKKAVVAPPPAVPAPKVKPAAKAPAAKPAAPKAAPPGESLPQSESEFKAHERETILHALMATNWNRLRAAAAIGMPRRTFYRRLRELGLENPPPKTPPAPVAQPAPAAQPATGKRKGRPANA